MLSWKSPIPSLCPAPLPTQTHFLALAFFCTGAYKVCKTKGPLFPNDGPLGHGRLFFPAFYSNVVSVFAIEVCFLYATKCWILLAYQSVSLWLFIGELSQLMLKDNKYLWLLVPVMFVVVGRIICMWFSPFDFIVRWLISYFFPLV